MSDRPSNPDSQDPVVFAREFIDLSLRNQRVACEAVERELENNGAAKLDPLGLFNAFSQAGQRMLQNPAKLADAQKSYLKNSMKLWQSVLQRWSGEEVDPVISPEKDDRRFKDGAWEEPLFDYLKQAYLLTAKAVEESLVAAEGIDKKTLEKVRFFSRQFVDAMAPTNSVLTNPEVIRTTIETKGENLLNEWKQLLDDIERGKGQLRIKMTDDSAFTPGKNIAVTPGKVVFQNDMMQLLQYMPITQEVNQTPILIVLPWINKFYILDLRPENSMIKWLVEQGHSVFVISWVNPDAGFANKSFDDYLLDGPLTAIEAIEKATGQPQVNAVGYCIGGTLLTMTLAYLAAKNESRIASATLLASLIDFSEPGEIGVFIDEQQLANLEEQMNRQGYLDGAMMADSFSSLRANDLMWSFVINNYLLGKEPRTFDLLYWNSDSTRMPAKMHSDYLRNMYLHNKLAESNGFSVNGVALDVSKIKAPSYFVSTSEDHIAPWKSCYMGAKLFSGPVKFVLGSSGHIAGVINPPAANKYNYKTLNGKLRKDPDNWLAKATAKQGSWWTDWAKWLNKSTGEKVPARVPGDAQLKVIEDAPGSYVKCRTDAAY